MKKTFEVTYEGHHIQVVNTWFNGERLFVDGTLQDEQVGFTLRGILTGSLKRSNGCTENIKVSIGGMFTVRCRIFVDNVLIYPKN